MAPGDVFDADPDDTEAALMTATYRALRDHGYADLTIQKIGDEFEKSTSLLYHHYDGKDELLVAFLDFLLDRFEDEVPFEDVCDPWTELQQVLDHALAPTVEPDREALSSAMIELRAQAAHDPAYRKAFSRHDRFFRDRLAGVIREGIERGAFRDVDPDRVAAFLQTIFNGAVMERATTDPDDGGVPVEAVRRELDSVLERYLLPEDPE